MIEPPNYWQVLERQCLHPALYDDPKAFEQARIMLLFCIVAGLLCLGTMAVGWWLKPDYAYWYSLVAIGHTVTCSSFLLLRVCPSMHIPSWTIAGLTILQLGQAPLWTGFHTSPVLFTYPLATMFMGVIGGRKHALWTGLILSCIAFVLFGLGEQFPSFAANDTPPFVYTVVLVWCTITAAALAFYTQNQEQKLLHRIEQELRERTQAQEETHKANVAKDMFLAYLSHEIRNPLTVIVATSDLVVSHYQSNTPNRAEIEQQMESLQTSALGLSRLLDDVFDFTSLEQSRLDLQVEILNFSKLVENVSRLYQSKAEKKGLEFYIDIEQAFWVRGDKVRLRQVLSNLLTNALKFTQTGSITIRLTSDVTTANQVVLSVIDTGKGISSEHLERIFRPFMRERSVHTPGIGLGLAICKGLIEQMGSTIQVESTVDQGSHFWFDLPLQKPSIVENTSTKTQKVDLDGVRVLIVDDNRDVGAILTSYCQSMEMDVRYCQDATVGLEVVPQWNPAVILLDLEMPTLSGVQFMRCVRNKGCQSKIILVTGSVIDPEKLTVDAIVQKPMAKERLRSVLLDVIEA